MPFRFIILLFLFTCCSPGSSYQDIEKSWVLVPSGEHLLGLKGHAINPARKIYIDSFLIRKYETTNAEFALFVQETGYVTLAESLKNGMSFHPGLEEYEWLEDSTANWRFPRGKAQGGIKGLENHPVTNISYQDALAYCIWGDYRLPTYDEWEAAARAGSGKPFFSGAGASNIEYFANIWHGTNHLEVDSSDIHVYTSPVGSYRESPIGLFDIFGNVFELCSGQPEAFKAFPGLVSSRGGSWWCSKNSCNYFNAQDIGRVQESASFPNVGFRVVKNIKQ